jgi:hypothetical protein
MEQQGGGDDRGWVGATRSFVDGVRARPAKRDDDRTATAPADLECVPGPAVALLIVGTGRQLDLPRDRQAFRIGSRRSSSDLVVRHALVSKCHAHARRSERGLLIEDAGSKNGLKVAGARVQRDEVAIGHRFELCAGVELLVLDTRLRQLRQELARGLGLDRHAAIDQTLMQLQHAAPFAFIGPRGCDQERMAQAIALATWDQGAFEVIRAIPRSPRAERELVERVWPGTVLFDFHALDDVPTAFLDLLLERPFGTRVVASAPDLSTLRRGFAGHRGLGAHVDVLPLAQRRSEIRGLLAEMLAAQGDEVAARSVLDRALDGFVACPWERNLEELRETVAVWAALIETRSATGAATALGWSRATMRTWLAKYRVTT